MLLDYSESRFAVRTGRRTPFELIDIQNPTNTLLFFGKQFGVLFKQFPTSPFFIIQGPSQILLIRKIIDRLFLVLLCK